MQLDDNLKQLMKELGAAINDALSDSEDISEAIQNVRNAGYDVFLVLEATIGFNKRSKNDQGEEVTSGGLKSGEMKLKVTAQDLKFLRSLKISVEDLDQQ
jgi:NADPH:quinone reductase-like Zn-dependent oxidoreductase